MPLEFGDYCRIEQERDGIENEIYTYKVIKSSRANYYRQVPVSAKTPGKVIGVKCDVVKVICCGVIEDTVETFRLSDVRNYIGEKVT